MALSCLFYACPYGEAADATDYTPSELACREAASVAGKHVGGLLAEALVLPPESGPGRPKSQMVVSLKNLNDRTVFLSRSYRFFRPPICTDENGKPVPWKAAAVFLALDFSGPTEKTPSLALEPGCAVAMQVDLNDLVDFPQPGNYTVIAGLDWVPFGPARAAPVKFSFGKTPIVPSKTEAIQTEPLALTGSSAARWRAMLALAGKPRDGLLLESLISPVYGRTNNLVVSVKNVGRSTVPGQRPAGESVPVTSGLVASDYELLVKDASGDFLPMREAGREWMAKHRLETGEAPAAKPAQMEDKRLIRLGEAVGFVFPLREMFDLRAGERYEVLVSLPRRAADSEPLVAGPVAFQVVEGK